jgi:hypothetical protein
VGGCDRRTVSGKSSPVCIYEDEPGWRSAAKLLTKDETRRIAANIAKLPELVLQFCQKPNGC